MHCFPTVEQCIQHDFPTVESLAGARISWRSFSLIYSLHVLEGPTSMGEGACNHSQSKSLPIQQDFRARSHWGPFGKPNYIGESFVMLIGPSWGTKFGARLGKRINCLL